MLFHSTYLPARSLSFWKRMLRGAQQVHKEERWTNNNKRCMKEWREKKAWETIWAMIHITMSMMLQMALINEAEEDMLSFVSMNK